MLAKRTSIEKYHFELIIGESGDGIALRYGCDPVKLSSICECGENFNTHLRHNDIRDSCQPAQ